MYKYYVIKRCHPLVRGNMTHNDASVETGVGGQAKYDVMMVFNRVYRSALQTKIRSTQDRKHYVIK